MKEAAVSELFNWSEICEYNDMCWCVDKDQWEAEQRYQAVALVVLEETALRY